MRPRLLGEGLLLRPFSPGDGPGLHAAVVESVAEIGPWLPWARPGYTMMEAEAWALAAADLCRREESFELVIADADSGRLLGGCGLNRIRRDHMVANLGYWVRTSATGRGIAPRAARLLAAWGLGELGLQRVEIVAAVDNTRSRRAAEKAGAVVEGVMRNGLRIHDTPHDAVLHSLIPSDL